MLKHSNLASDIYVLYFVIIPISDFLLDYLPVPIICNQSVGKVAKRKIIISVYTIVELIRLEPKLTSS